MIRLSQIAAPGVIGVALVLGAVGCSHDRDVPASAEMISSGTTETTATAPANGTVYVWDDHSNKMMYIGKVEKGDRVRVDAKHDKIYFNDRVATEHELWDSHNYQIYFDRSGKDVGTDATVVRHRDGSTEIRGTNGTTVIEPNARQDTVIQRGDGSTVVTPNGNTTVVQPAPADQDRTVIKKETVIEH